MNEVKVIYGLVKNENDEILAVHNIKHDTWSLPGGSVEANETLREAVIREFYEETGFDVEVKNIVAINEGKILKHNNHALFITFNCKITGGNINNNSPKEISKIKWIKSNEIDNYITYYQSPIKDLFNYNAEYFYEGEFEI
ncbi:phosphohydrolase (MutT/nudix family protein) [Mammaliicoccus lentus]|uniref:NUDIX hydrolase n=1 Tax=Mammaliicoccus lentus TaxID=42858 RepID=UPI00085BF927|nr:NUDIX hydrolase [Mammaliicoccus lentus]SCU43852.1 phosphohydrolase (MutT/nudix family protein) [Mammaliicoccus lentus]